MLVAWLAVHLVLDVYPSYASGLYQDSRGRIFMGYNGYAPPLYGEPRDGANPMVRLATILTLFSYVLWPLSVLMVLLPIVVRRRSFRWRERIGYPAIALGTIAIVALTWHIAGPFLYWLSLD
jgi:hypothetical protein